ncbi:MAG: leucine-rich repeat domain-containing protein, partial [Clostridia bacterium]|nr:leucine-rich repeat domain-containing protein [Clostridia bacterium]
VEIYDLGGLGIQAGVSYNNSGIGITARVVHTNINTPTTLQTINGVVYYINDNDFAPVTIADDTLSTIVFDSRITEFGIFVGGVVTSVDLSNCNKITVLGGSFGANLTSITLPDSITHINDCGFYNTQLASIVLPANLVELGDAAFGDCWSLKSIDMSKCTKLKNIGWYSLASHGLSLTIPSSVTKISYEAFTGLNSLTFEMNEGEKWYITDSETNWNNMTGGTEIDVSNPSTNASNFSYGGQYSSYYLYKK